MAPVVAISVTGGDQDCQARPVPVPFKGAKHAANTSGDELGSKKLRSTTGVNDLFMTVKEGTLTTIIPGLLTWQQHSDGLPATVLQALSGAACL